MKYKCTNAFKEAGRTYRYDDEIDRGDYVHISPMNQQWFYPVEETAQPDTNIQEGPAPAVSSTHEPESDWLSPIESERNNQIEKLKQIIPGYPESYENWQVLNTLLALSLQAIEPGTTNVFKFREERDVQDEFRMIISHALLGCDTSDVPKETWDLVISECTKYALSIKTQPDESDKYDQNAFNPM